MKHLRFYHLVIHTLFFSACLSTQAPTQRLTNTPIASLVTTPNPTLPTVSITPTLKGIPKQNCLVIQNSTPPTESVNGYLIVNSSTETNTNSTNIYALNLQEDEKLPLLESEGGIQFEPNAYTISQDRKRFIYFTRDTDGRSILNLGAIGNKNYESVYWDTDWGEHAIWLSQDWLFIPPNTNRQSAIILNPFNGEWRELISNFPSGLNFAFPFFYYNSNLSNAIYISGDNYVLWNANANADIWIKPTYGPYLAPKWSQDGSHVAMIIRDEFSQSNAVRDNLVIVDQQGNEINITDFLQSYRETNSIEITAFEWSPDNQHVAFSLDIKEPLDNSVIPTLFVVDTLTNQVVDYCVSISNNSNIVWSPNGEYLAVQSSNQGDQTGSSIVLINITQDWAARIAENVTLLGWMIKSPE